ncbi:MAG: ribulose-phosphate 3-epimerase [Candidatus Thermoplasmatota archaeon]|nr:ribulose-phosphate 3-epimerase [Candidatus Thermoplasmatota archaeon]
MTDIDKVKISPSILSADFSDLESAVKAVKSTEWLHLDVMDGHFVPNLTFGPCVIESIRDKTEHVFDTHLMISNPDEYIDDFVKAGSDIITFHVEAVDDIEKAVKDIKGTGTKAGLSLKPGTEFEAIEEFLPSIDLILIMTVKPGFSGQEFMEEVVPKIRKSRDAVDEQNYDIDIAVDGGISPKTAGKVVENGANVLVSGSSVFEGDIERNLKELRDSFE